MNSFFKALEISFGVTMGMSAAMLLLGIVAYVITAIKDKIIGWIRK